MTVPFKQIPSNLRVPLFYAEIDNSRANTGADTMRTLIIGQMTATGTAPANVPVLCAGVAEAKTLAGVGSMLASMVDAYRANDSFGEMWLLPLADDAGGVQATGTLTFTGTTTAVGVLSLYVAGHLVPVTLAAGSTAAQAATAVAAAVNANTDLAAAAAASAGVVTFTARHKGAVGNDIDLRLNYLGSAGGETTPAGLTVAFVAMASGATNPTLTSALANLLDRPYDFIVSPYTDTASITAISALLNDTTGRWSWQQQVYGHAFIAQRGTQGSLATFGTGLNDQHLSCMGFYDSPTSVWRWAAAYAGAAAVSLRADPATPLQTVVIAGVKAPPLQSRFSISQRNVLLFDGVATFRVGNDGTVAIENLITTYQKNGFGQADNSYLEVETLYTLAFVLRRMASVITSKYARVKLAADGTRLAPGSNVVTPSTIKADLIAQYRELEDLGVVQGARAFAQAIVVEKDATNPNRVNVLWPGTLINQLRIFALLAQFRLS